jgi:hypothetical protein
MQGQAVQAPPLARRALWKVPALIVLVVVLGGLAAFALERELRAKPAAPSAGAAFSAGLAMGAPHTANALTPEEEAYASALWPIHSEVKMAAVRMTFAGLNYKTEGEDAARLKAAVQPLIKSFADASKRVERITPPASLRDAHASYLGALTNYSAASREMLKVVDDGRDAHLIAAHQRSQQASHELLKLSDVLWPGEYKPN